MNADTPIPTAAERAIRLMNNFRFKPDDWQLDVLLNRHPRLLLNCCRQSGKTTVVGFLALADALFIPDTMVLILSRSHRQSAEFLKKIREKFERLDQPLKLRNNKNELSFTNGSRILCLPCREDTVRGYANVDLLVIDEAALVPDDLYRALRPMLAVSNGRIVCLSTPHGKRGFFYDAWTFGGDDWARIEIPATKVPRISPAYLEQERRALGEAWYRQEFFCSFEALEGLVYPDFSQCVVDELPRDLAVAAAASQLVAPGKVENWSPQNATDREDERNRTRLLVQARQAVADGSIRFYGGIDFGFRNPFAAVWGLLDRDDVLWLVGEHYQRYRPTADHARHLPKQVTWYADPAGATERCELRRADLVVRKGDNALRSGIAAVSRRVGDGTLKIVKGACTNLLAEAGLYRYDDRADAEGSETPLAEHNHALDALRYLIASIDKGRAPRVEPAGKPEPTAAEIEQERARRYQEIMNDDSPNSPYWRRVG